MGKYLTKKKRREYMYFEMQFYNTRKTQSGGFLMAKDLANSFSSSRRSMELNPSQLLDEKTYS